ncbi:MAG: sulfite exporter TauE/SafE family protein [Bacteroidia bacterium]
MDLIYWTALSVGFLGSFHCAGMCGPLALALPGSNGSMLSLVSGRLTYNLGRVVTYSILGLIAGLLGHTFSIRGWQSDLSILSGILIILFVLFSNKKVLQFINSHLVGISYFFKQKFGLLMKRHSAGSLFLIGLLNGILPCGFVYLALAGAATTGGFMEGATYMFLFGTGTIPMMMMIALSGSFISLKARNIINKLSPVIAIALAIFLIHRGSMMKESDHACCKPHHSISYNTGSPES